MSYSFGNARRFYARGIHPRVLLGPGDLVELKRRIRSGVGRKVMDAIREHTRPLVRQALNATEPDALLQPPFTDGHFGGIIFFALDEMAMLGKLDDDADAIEAVRRILHAIIPADIAQEGKTIHPFSYGGMRHLALSYDLLHDQFSNADRATFSGWFVERCVRRTMASLPSYLRNSGANTPIAGMATAFFSLLAVEGDPGVPDLQPEREELLRMCEASLNTTFGSNGYSTEDIGYGTGVGALMGQLAEALRRAGLFDAYRAAPRFSRFGRAVLQFVQPWGEYLSNTGDHGDDFRDRQLVLARLATVTRDPTLLWLLGTLSFPPNTVGQWVERTRMYFETELAKGYRVPASWLTLAVLDDLKAPVHPAKRKVPTAFVDRERGIVSFRSDWDRDATFVVFDGSQRSPSAQGHAHDSGGHFSISALGEYFAIDTGRYSTEQDQHNVVLVDGKSGRSTNGDWRMSFYHANLIEYEPGGFCDYAAVDSSHQHNCYWARRHLGLVKGPGAPAYAWTVEDINKANDWAEFWWTLNTCPANRIEIQGDTATIHGQRFGNALDVFFALPHPTAYPKPHQISLTQNLQRCGSPNYVADTEIGNKLAAYGNHGFEMVHGPVFQRPRLVANIGGYNGRFMSVMIPRRKDEPRPKVERLSSLDNSLAVRITFAQVEDTLIFAYEHNLLEAGDVKARGQWIVVRRARKSGKQLARFVWSR